MVIILRVAFISGGKDSYYAVYRFGAVDLGLMLIYDFPRPSPHILNLGKSIETMLLCRIPIIVAKLDKGREFTETIEILKKFSTNTIVAGDVYIEEHLKYMEHVAESIGAKLYEPLWGMDAIELLYKEIESGIRTLIIGGDKRISNWVGEVLDLENIDNFVRYAKNIGIDPLGENGEYHTLVLQGPLHIAALQYRVIGFEEYEGYGILRVV